MQMVKFRMLRRRRCWRPAICKPGGEYQYTNGTVLETSLGTMKGTYQMIKLKNYFDAEIPEFVLTILELFTNSCMS